MESLVLLYMYNTDYTSMYVYRLVIGHVFVCHYTAHVIMIAKRLEYWIFVVWGVFVGGSKWADQTAEDCFWLKQRCEMDAWISAVFVHWQQTSAYLSLLYNFLIDWTAWILSWEMIRHNHVSFTSEYRHAAIVKVHEKFKYLSDYKNYFSLEVSPTQSKVWPDNKRQSLFFII